MCSFLQIYLNFLKIKDKTNKIKNTTNRIFAIHALVPATPLKPKNPAIIAITRKIIAYLSIFYPLLKNFRRSDSVILAIFYKYKFISLLSQKNIANNVFSEFIDFYILYLMA